MTLSWYNIAIPSYSLNAALDYYPFFARHIAIGNCRPKDAEFISYTKYYNEIVRHFHDA